MTNGMEKEYQLSTSEVSSFISRYNTRAGGSGSANVRFIRPAHGLHTRHLEEVLGRRASRDIERGTLLKWGLVK